MATNNSQNSQFANNADGYTLGGGTTSRNLTVTGANITLTGSGSNTYTMPSATDTLVGRASTDVLTNKDLTSSTNSFPSTTLGYAQITSNFTTTSSSATQVTGLSITVIIPSGGRRVRVTVWSDYVDNATSGVFVTTSLWQGTVGSGTQLARNEPELGSNSRQVPVIVSSVTTPSAGSVTYNAGLATTGGTGVLAGSTTSPAYILAELI